MWVQWHPAGEHHSTEPLPESDTDHGKQYWDWGRWASSPETSPIFDGSDTSISGQGIKTTHNSNGMKPAGQGGGCIEKGPFKDMKVNLGYTLFIRRYLLAY
jgi:tyrosinase